MYIQVRETLYSGWVEQQKASNPMTGEAGTLNIVNARIACFDARGGRGTVIPNGAIQVALGRITAVGAQGEMPVAGRTIDAGGRWVTPGLIDCHTHLVYGGNRSNEFAMRLEGARYEDIAAAGGGIVASVRATRAADDATLLARALKRVDGLIADGVTTVEIKSGYGLDLATEARMLRIARQIGTLRPINVATTYLGAHALPAEQPDRDGYIDWICAEALPSLAAEGLIDAVDGFCETIAFTPAQIARLFTTAKALGLPVKLHAEQLSNQGGAAVAAGFGALSADHLEHLDAAGIAAMASAGTIAVMLPGSFYALRETRKPPVAALRAAGVPMAVATDLNPGTSPVHSLLLAMNMAAVLFGLTIDECLAGVTRNAGAALGLRDSGSIMPGHWADLAIWDVDDLAELVTNIGARPLHTRIHHGNIA